MATKNSLILHEEETLTRHKKKLFPFLQLYTIKLKCITYVRKMLDINENAVVKKQGSLNDYSST